MHTATLTVTRGLPASGKTHELADLAAMDCSRDRFRQALAGPHWNHGSADEKLLTDIQFYAISALLRAGKDVKVADCNLDPLHVRALDHVAYAAGAEFEVVNLMQVPLDDCLARNAGRPPETKVPEEVIVQLHKRWIEGQP